MAPSRKPAKATKAQATPAKTKTKPTATHTTSFLLNMTVYLLHKPLPNQELNDLLASRTPRLTMPTPPTSPAYIPNRRRALLTCYQYTAQSPACQGYRTCRWTDHAPCPLGV